VVGQQDRWYEALVIANARIFAVSAGRAFDHLSALLFPVVFHLAMSLFLPEQMTLLAKEYWKVMRYDAAP
jgi:hypothetical protein